MPWLILQPSERRPRMRMHEVVADGRSLSLVVGEAVWSEELTAEGVNQLLSRVGLCVVERGQLGAPSDPDSAATAGDDPGGASAEDQAPDPVLHAIQDSADSRPAEDDSVPDPASSRRQLRRGEK